jgi:succinate dehydrogenase / fumarate reductase cytochrome b subunit
MSTKAPTKKQKRTNSVPSGQSIGGWVGPHLGSSVGGKYLVAVTGLIMTGFVIAHMAGNLQIFFSQKRINDYAVALKEMGPLLWGARVFLLITLVVHMAMSLKLNWNARKARPIGYAYEQTVQASFASRHMVLTGLVIFAFLVFHIAHFTLGVVQGAEVAPGRFVNYLDLVDQWHHHDVYSMMIYGFREPILAILYIVAQLFLFLHLTHGVASMFQTVGLNSPRAQRLIRGLAWTVALVVCLGNVSIVAAAWSGWLLPMEYNLVFERGAQPVLPAEDGEFGAPAVAPPKGMPPLPGKKAAEPDAKK